MDFQEAGKILGRKGHKLYTVVGPKGFQCLVDGTYNYTADEIVMLAKSGRPPGTKIWRQIICSEKVGAEGLMNRVAKAYQDAGVPKGVEIYHEQSGNDHAYYFSPEAMQLLSDNLGNYTVSLCFEPETANMRKVQL